jgi:hypothetical protein
MYLTLFPSRQAVDMLSWDIILHPAPTGGEMLSGFRDGRSTLSGVEYAKVV